MQRVDFYVLSGIEERPRLKVACRIAERAYLAGERVFVWLDGANTLERFDDLLWTFADRGFVPHEIFQNEAQWPDTPVLLGCDAQRTWQWHAIPNPHEQDRSGRGDAACAC